VISSLDDKGRWVRKGYIEMRVFIRNIRLLCDYLEAASSSVSRLSER